MPSDATNVQEVTKSATSESPALRMAREELELRKIELEQHRLELDDRVARSELSSKMFTNAVTTAKATLPSTLDTSIEKDSLTQQGEAIGLAEVYAGRSCHAPLDDIADRVVAATNSIEGLELLVVSDTTIFADAQLAQMLRAQLQILRARMRELETNVEPSEGVDMAGGAPAEPSGAEALLPTAVGLLPALINLVPSGISLLSKLLAHQYTVAGTRIDEPDFGIDLRLARFLLSKTQADGSVRISVDRLWAPPDSGLAADVVSLVAGQPALIRAVRDAEVRRRSAKAAMDAAEAALVAVRLRLLELSKASSPDQMTDAGPSTWKIAWDAAIAEQASLSQALPGLIAEHSDTVTKATELRALLSDIEDFVATTLTSGADGKAPLMRALRGEWLRASDNRVVVYVSGVAAGADQVLDTKLGPDKRAVVAGTTLEFGAVGHDGRLLASGAVDSFWGGTMNLSRPDAFDGRAIDYHPFPNQGRPAPT
jgi:hypothetical protein